MFEGEYEEFTVIRVNLNTVRKDDKEQSYNEDNFYLEFNNVEHYNII